MPPKASSTKAAAATKTSAAAKNAPASKKDAKPDVTAAVPKTSKAKAPAKPTVNGNATKKRKASEETESEKDEEIKEDIEEPKSKKAKTAPATKETASKAKPKPKAEPKASKAKEITAAKKTGASKKTATASKPKVSKRKAEEPEDDASEAEPQRKKSVASTPDTEDQPSKTETKRKAPAKAAKTAPVRKERVVSIGKQINSAPTQRLDVYVFGEGSSGELGLGSKKVNGKKPIDVKRPRLNDHLAAKNVGVVQIACGGMHAAALTQDNQILTWGVNDQGALGRDTNWDGGLRDMDNENSDSEDEDEDDTGMNPKESTPTAVSAEHFAPGTKFVQVIASDSATFALTEDGRVYGWGTFRVG
jgi:regulator of chromosome condensation